MEVRTWSAVAMVSGVLLCAACSSDSESGTGSVPLGGAGISAMGAGAGGFGASGAGSGGAGAGAAGAGSTGIAGNASAGGGGVGAAGTSAAGSGGASGGAGTGASGEGGIGAGEDAAPATGPFPPVTDFEADGPFASTSRTNVGPNDNYAIYLPTELAPGGAKNPIVAWTSGGGTSHTGYVLLPHLATHGFVVITANTIPGIGAEAALGQEMIAGIEWLLAENERSGSEFYGKLDASKIAASGYSMGSLATFTIAQDPRLTTTLHISGGNMAPERVENLHAPAAFICGTPGGASCNILSGDCDIAAANCDLDFENASTPVFYANFQGGHLGILTPPLSTRISGMSTAWLRYTLMNDRTLEPWFVGAGCEYCQDSAWTVQQKNLP